MSNASAGSLTRIGLFEDGGMILVLLPNLFTIVNCIHDDTKVIEWDEIAVRVRYVWRDFPAVTSHRAS